jgi:hypothetical protein
LHFEAGKLPQTESLYVELIEKFKDDDTSFVAPKKSSTSDRLKYSSPVAVILEITTQLLTAGHKNPME